jgi:hypothetical protein
VRSLVVQGGEDRNSVLKVNYPGGKNRQISLRRDQLPQVRRHLSNYLNSRRLWRPFANSTRSPCVPMTSHTPPGANVVIKARHQPAPSPAVPGFGSESFEVIARMHAVSAQRRPGAQK